ncbi:hypothetical protein ES332_A06G139600v1 [Gossypium tomentosum]|uniref:Uncharacterized protein n=1 Tax=Gossypium tomentosum TaxID=34277 RepID=A0A5D2Q761_GOSTO|nr:hypothetical protein ES332_A06G139600v1 [Gossypium tomentosum]
MVFFARYGRTEEMARMGWRPCTGISRGKPTLCCPSSVWARFRIWVYEFWLKLYLGWYKLFIRA